jgi:hypothetical protein
MGFALDLGRLYLIRGELNQAASSMALTAAGKLIGTAQSLDDATAASQQLLDDSTGHGLKYNFGANLIGQTTGLLSSAPPTPAFFSTMAAATGNPSAIGDQADGTTARHVQVTLTADAPLLFWSFLSVGQSRTTPVSVQAVAGISSPVCVACGIEPLAVAAISADDTTDYGFVAGQRYTFTYQCTPSPPANPLPTGLSGSVVFYVLLDHYDPSNVVADEPQQLYRTGAAGLVPSGTRALSCVTIGAQEALYGTNSGGTSAQPRVCGTGVASVVTNMLCGLYSRLDTSQTAPAACSTVTDVDALTLSYPPDSDITDLDDYTAYVGNARRVITIPIVDTFSDMTAMTVLGFRQFLIEPNPGDVVTNPSDQYARFVALYIGMSPADSNTTPVPVKQGSISGCANGAPAGQGPGKVVLHQ